MLNYKNKRNILKIKKKMSFVPFSKISYLYAQNTSRTVKEEELYKDFFNVMLKLFWLL